MWKLTHDTVQEANNLRNVIGYTCEQYFQQMKEHYNSEAIRLESLGKVVVYENQETKFKFTSFMRERVVGEGEFPIFEFVENQNEAFGDRFAGRWFASAGDEAALSSLEKEVAERYQSGMMLSFSVGGLAAGDKQLAKGVLDLMVLEEFLMKNGVGPETRKLQSRIRYTGAAKERNVSLLDYRYVSILVQYHLAGDDSIDGVWIVLLDRSLIDIEDLERADSAARKWKTEQTLLGAPYLERLKKYSNLLKPSPQFDESTLYRFFLEMDLDRDLLVGKEDLWNFCKKQRIDIQRSVLE
jgi:hypothetical protein